MNFNKVKEYYVIFDTNTLFQKYESKADFTSFSFNRTYDTVVNMINQLDIYGDVKLTIPEVVWKEMENQIIEKHDELLSNFRNTVKKKTFPEFLITEISLNDYAGYIKPRIDEYKCSLSSGLNTIVELPIAKSNRFESIVQRAFEKRPPFEGKEKKSDKGFKDALLWESILEFVSTHPCSNIIYYSKDNVFDDFLIKEFEENHSAAVLNICKNEDEVRTQLEFWAKEIDIYSFQPIMEYQDNAEISNWINSADFENQLNGYDFGLAEKGKLIMKTFIKLVGYDNIQITNENDEEKSYLFDAVLEINYTLKGGAVVSDTIDVQVVTVENNNDKIYLIEDAYRIEDDDAAESDE